MKKRIVSILMVCVMCCVTLFSANTAMAVDMNDADIVRDEMNEKLAVIFEYLNGQNISLLQHEKKEYNIPVGDEIVTVTVENEQVQKGRGIGLNYYTIAANTSYIYTLTISNIHNGSGNIVYTVNYDVGNASGTSGSYATLYKMTVNRVGISATSPSGFDVDDYGTFINRDYDDTIVGRTTGYVVFGRTLLSDVGVTILVKFGTLTNSQVQVSYEYEIN